MRLKLKNIDTAKMVKKNFTNCFRYLHDFLGCNNNGLIKRYKDEICGLNMNRQNNEDTTEDYLSLYITIKNNKFVTSIYNKRDDYDYDIIKFTHTTSNTCVDRDMDVIYGQLHNYTRICDRLEDVIKRITNDMIYMIEDNGLPNKPIWRRIEKFFQEREDKTKKYNITPKQMMTQLR